MSRTFPGSGTSDYLENTDSLSLTEPFTVAAWVKPDGAKGDWVIFGQYDSTDSNTWHGEIAISSATGGAKCSKRNTSNEDAISSNTVTANVWNHICGRFIADDDRASYLDGDAANKGTNTVSVTDPGTNNQRIGLRGDGSPNASFDGGIAYVSIWDGDLTEAEVLLLAQGANPTWIRRDILIALWPIWGAHSPEIDIIGGRNMTINGTLGLDTTDPPVSPIIFPSFVTRTAASISLDNEKLAFMEWGIPWEPGLPVNPGSFGQDDKQQLLWGYPDILWATPGGTATNTPALLIGL